MFRTLSPQVALTCTKISGCHLIERGDPFHHPSRERSPPADAHSGSRQHVTGPLIAGVGGGVFARRVVEHVARPVTVVTHPGAARDRTLDCRDEPAVLSARES